MSERESVCVCVCVRVNVRVYARTNTPVQGIEFAVQLSILSF